MCVSDFAYNHFGHTDLSCMTFLSRMIMEEIVSVVSVQLVKGTLLYIMWSLLNSMRCWIYPPVACWLVLAHAFCCCATYW